jgi:hypothetical protein
MSKRIAHRNQYKIDCKYKALRLAIELSSINYNQNNNFKHYLLEIPMTKRDLRGIFKEMLMFCFNDLKE